jgi:hypothetical protein
VGEHTNGALMPRAAALARPDGSVLLVCGEAGSRTSALVAALVESGHIPVADETTVLDPETLEVQLPAQTATETAVPSEPLELRLVVVPELERSADGVRTTRMPGSEAAYLIGSRCALLGEVSGGPLPALARLARRVPAYHVRYADHRLVAEEVLRLWREM